MYTEGGYTSNQRYHIYSRALNYSSINHCIQIETLKRQSISSADITVAYFSDASAIISCDVMEALCVDEVTHFSSLGRFCDKTFAVGSDAEVGRLETVC